MQKTERIIGITRKTMVNTVSSISLKNLEADTIFTLTGLAIVLKEEPEEKIKYVGYLQDNEGCIYNTISPSVIKSMEAIMDYMEEEQISEVVTSLKKQRSRNGRDFLYLTI